MIGPLFQAIPFIGSLVGRIFGNKETAQAQDTQLRESLLSADTQSLSFYATNRNWWDSLIDGIMRLPRPAIIFMLITYLFLSFLDPIQFQIINEGLASIPDNMWEIIMGVLGALFAIRELKHHRDNKSSAERNTEFRERLTRMEELRVLKSDVEVKEEKFEAAMADTTQPLSNEVILEWNRRRGLL